MLKLIPFRQLARAYSFWIISIYTSAIAMWLAMPADWQNSLMDIIGKKNVDKMALAGFLLLLVARIISQNLGEEKPKDPPPITGHGVL